MIEHAHEWKPIDGQWARYACECGATGYRRSTGEIAQHKTARTTAQLRAPEITRRIGGGPFTRLLGGGRRLGSANSRR